MEGRFNGGFFALPFWGAYFWRGLFSEFYGMYEGAHIYNNIIDSFFNYRLTTDCFCRYPYFFMTAVETLALVVCQNTVINGITICDEDTNNGVTPAVLFDMTSAPTPFKPGGTRQSFISGGSAPRFSPLLYVPFLTKKVPFLN